MNGTTGVSGRVPGPTLRRRLERALGRRMLVGWALTALAVGAAVRHDVDELYDTHLVAVADVVAALDAATADPGAGWHRTASGTADDELQIRYRLRVSDGAAAVPTGDDPPVGLVDEDGERAVRAPLSAAGPGTAARTVEIRQELAERRRAILDVLLAMLLPALLIIPFGVLGLRATLARELAPLDALAAEIDRRDGRDLSPVVATGVPGELDTVVRGLDRLLSRLRGALDAERDFAGTAAHELRTPLAGALAQTQRLVVETDGAARARARRVEGSLRALQHLTERLLELARADGAGTTVERVVDLEPALESTVALLGRERDAAARLAFDGGGSGPLLAHLDPDAFSVLLRNLVENALVHGTPGSTVNVRRQARSIEVDNAGPVLDAAERVRLGHRFARGDGGGAGLGLAIVHAIVEGGGVDVELLSPVPGLAEGVRARIVLDVPPTRPDG